MVIRSVTYRKCSLEGVSAADPRRPQVDRLSRLFHPFARAHNVKLSLKTVKTFVRRDNPEGDRWSVGIRGLGLPKLIRSVSEFTGLFSRSRRSSLELFL
ncbi:hypothetical protein AVEN_132440-1 [Araneus ventricosus]|uniref:Uncharacterized protein n=1 Tax=Araneus ventricosus TaxID=182803 RepID=A0A4Y2IH05_ARAVE|nr:hypothetical protein AVEN_132440-1 [Araneus ventricosus]